MNIKIEDIKTVEQKGRYGTNYLTLYMNDGSSKTFAHHGKIDISTKNPDVEKQLAQNEAYEVVDKIIKAEIEKRGLIAIRGGDNWHATYTVYFTPETRKKPTNSQSNALYYLLNREINDAINDIDSSDHYIQSGQIHSQTKQALIKLGYVAMPLTKREARFSNNDNHLVLTELGREKAQELYPELTVEQREEENEIRFNLDQRRVEIKREIRKHFRQQLSSGMLDLCRTEINHISGKIEDVKFIFPIDGLKNEIRVQYKGMGYKTIAGWYLEIVADQGYSVRDKTSVQFDPLQLETFIESNQAAINLIKALNDKRLEDYSGDLE